MVLYLVQHGEAKREEEDPSRGLTKKGMDDVWKVAAFVRKMNVNVNRILHSGKTRTMQTALAIADFLQPEVDIIETDGLAPMDDPGIWAGRLAGRPENIMLVGHLPYLAKLAGMLLCGDKEKVVVDFKMGGIVCLKQFDDGHWSLEWMIVPEMIG